MKYMNRNTDLDALRANIASYLQADGFKIQQPKPGQDMMLIQAQKGGFLRELISSERALNILIQGQPNDFTIRVGIGKWIQNIAVTAVETVLISELFLPLDVAEMLWNIEVEKKVVKKIDELVSTPQVRAM
ncbi:MAG: hypothetical protein OK441_02410 [Thaumarchaeota archaeon]|nr:hypothetical protein [Nitrososphaerota archaeon]